MAIASWFRGWKNRFTAKPIVKAPCRYRLTLELLEDRMAPAILTVTSVADTIAVDGFVTLREAITSANNNANVNADVVASGAYGVDTINFNITGAGVRTISPTAALPTLTGPVTIAGNTQPGFAGTPIIELNGTGAGAGVNGLTMNAAGVVLRSLVINNFGGNGILALGANGAIEGCFIGTNAAGTAAQGNGLSGVAVTGAATANRIGGTGVSQRNVISGNGNHGVALVGAGVTGTLIQGNFIGTDLTAAVDLGNALDGISLSGGTRNNSIGRTTIGGGAFNIIAGNNRNGILLRDSTTTGNVILGNSIGSNVAGIAGLGNGAAGVAVTNAKNNLIGSPNADANIIVSNIYGVTITGKDATGNRVHGNSIGFIASTGAVRANFIGVWIAGASGNTIGGAAVIVSNTISGNTSAGVVLIGSGTINNTVSNNFIGTDASGTAAKANGGDGISIGPGVGSTIVANNLISGNGGNGVAIRGAGVTGVVVRANTIGMKSTGNVALPNVGSGVLIGDGASNNTIGGVTAGFGNLIGGNSQTGINIGGVGTNGNKVQGNSIGINAAGTAAAANQGPGVFVHDGAKNTLIGGTVGPARNTISGNSNEGILISIAGTTGTLVQGNFIGTDVTGTLIIANGSDGILILGGAANNTVGGTVAGARNVISGNNDGGIRISGSGTTGNNVQGNFIGTDVTGTLDRGNDLDGILIEAGAANNTVGGTVTGARNVIAGNGGNGVAITNAGTTGNLVLGNFIGTDVTGTLARPNDDDGVNISGGAANNTVGGIVAGARNVISGNSDDGIELSSGGTAGNKIQGNFIGTNAAGTADLGNNGEGVEIRSNALNNTIGGIVVGARNVISGNQSDGIEISTSIGSVVQGNFIGTNAAGTADLGNAEAGVALLGSAIGTTVGGTAPLARNVISGNDKFGVLIRDSGTNANVVQGNFIGLAANGTTPLGNTSHGVFITAATINNSIGGTAAGAGNRIAHNGGDGVLIGSDPGAGFNTPAGGGNSVLGNAIFSNAGQGIDLGANDGPTANDNNDPDTGPNELLNTPTLASALLSGTTLDITGFINTAAGKVLRIEFFASPPNGQGQTFLGFQNVTMAGNTIFFTKTLTVPASVLKGHTLTATITDELGNTSEFTIPIPIE